MAYRASIIKSIQTRSYTIPSGSTSATVNLSPTVTRANAIIIPGGSQTASNLNSTEGNAALVLDVGGATVTVTTFDNSVTPNAAGSFTVVEFYGNLLTANGVQRGTIVVGVAELSHDATITATGVHAFAVPSGFYTGAAAHSQYVMNTLTLSAATTATVTRHAQDGATSVTGAYQVPDFK